MHTEPVQNSGPVKSYSRLQNAAKEQLSFQFEKLLMAKGFKRFAAPTIDRLNGLIFGGRRTDALPSATMTCGKLYETFGTYVGV